MSFIFNLFIYLYIFDQTEDLVVLSSTNKTFADVTKEINDLEYPINSEMIASTRMPSGFILLQSKYLFFSSSSSVSLFLLSFFLLYFLFLFIFLLQDI